MTYSGGYSDNTDTTSDVSIENEYNVVEAVGIDSGAELTIDSDIKYKNTYLGDLTNDSFVVTSSSRTTNDIYWGGYNPMVTGAVDFYECQKGYGGVDLGEIQEKIDGALTFGVSKYDPDNVNIDEQGELVPQFGEGQDCVNIPIDGGWDYVDYTYYTDFQGSYGDGVIPIRTTKFGPPTTRSNIDYSNGRAYKGQYQFGVIKGDIAVDFNFVKPDGGGVINDIDEDTTWQSGPRNPENDYLDHKVTCHPAGGAGAPMTAAVAIDPRANDANKIKENYYEYYSAINTEQVFETDSRYDYMPVRQLVYVNHKRDDNAETTPDFGVMGVSGWLYGLQTKVTGEKNQVMSGFTPTYNHSAIAINYVYGVYKKDKSDEELESFEADLTAYLDYLNDIIEEINSEDQQTNSYNARFANEPYSEHRLKPNYLGRFIEGGLLERQRRNILKDNNNNHMLLQLTFEHICSNLPINEGKKPHEKEFPFTSDRLNEQLAADGELSMETFLDYLFAVFNNIPDDVIRILGYIPKLSDLANFVHHKVEPSDPGFFRYYLYNFILWACRPERGKKIKKFSIEKSSTSIGDIVLPSPTMWFEDDSYISLDEWLNYETGGFEEMCGRMDGIMTPRVVTLPDGSKGYNEIECLEGSIEEYDDEGNVIAMRQPRVLMTRQEHAFIGLSGNIERLEEGEELEGGEVQRISGVFYDMLEERKKVLRGIYRSWSKTDIDNLAFEIPEQFADVDAKQVILNRASDRVEPKFIGDTTDTPTFGFATKEEAKKMNKWLDVEMYTFYQTNVGVAPEWSLIDDPDHLEDMTYEFHPWVPNSNDPPDKEMVTHYIWISLDDHEDPVGTPKQKPHFRFWFGKTKGGTRGPGGKGTWEMGPSSIQLHAPQLGNPEDPKARIYRIEVPSGRKAGRENRFFRIGAFYPKSDTNMTNDPKVMGERSEWHAGKKFKFEIRPAKKNENDIGKDPNKGPVYHAKHNGHLDIMKQGEPLWYDHYWKNPRNYVKDGNRPLDMNKWYALEWNESYVKEKPKPHCRFWWGANKDSITPMETLEPQRNGLFFSTAQVLLRDDKEEFLFKPLSKYLYFGGVDSGRNMSQWSDDGEPWVTIRRLENPPVQGPCYYADYGNTINLVSGDIQGDLLHWQEDMNAMEFDKMSEHTYTIMQRKMGYINFDPSGVPLGARNYPVRVPITSPLTKTTRIWRYKKSVPVSARESHLFQYMTNHYMLFPKLSGKTAVDFYRPTGKLADEDGPMFTMRQTYTPYIARDLGQNSPVDAVILHDSSNLIQWGRYQTQPTKLPNSTNNNKVPRTLENWSRLGEPEQITNVPLLSPTGSFYWALLPSNSAFMSDVDPGLEAETLNNYNATAYIGFNAGVINIYHRHWPGPEASNILPTQNRFNIINSVFNHEFNENEPEGPTNRREVEVKKGKYYKFKFPTEAEAIKILDQVWRQQHEDLKAIMPAGTSQLPGVDDPNLEYNFPLGMKFRVNWMKNTWRVPMEYQTSQKFEAGELQKLMIDTLAWEDQLFEPGKEYTIKAKGDAFCFGVASFDRWRSDGMQFGSKMYKDQENYASTTASMGNQSESPYSMWKWSPYGLHFPFEVTSAPNNQGPEYYANPGSYIETNLPDSPGSDFRQSVMGEINFAKYKDEVNPRKGDWWKMPMSYWTPGKNDHDFHAKEYNNGKAKATKIKPHRMYKVSWMKPGINMHPWDCDFVFVPDEIKSDNTKLISRFHYANEDDQYGNLLGNERSAFKAPETLYFPDKGGYCKDKDGKVIRLEKSSLSGYVLLLSTSENLIMGAHNPAQAGAADTAYKTEELWQKKGEKTHLKIEETTVDYWQDGWAYWAASGHDNEGRANFFSQHWNLPMKHISPGFIVEGDEYEVVAMPNMSPNIVYHLWWAPAGIEDHFEEVSKSDPTGSLQNMLKNSLRKSDQTLVAGTTIKVKAKGDRLLLAATNTGILREDLWSPDAEGAPIKIRRLPADRDPIGPGYYGTRNATNNSQYHLNNIHWKEIWDWNSWMTFQDEHYSENLDRFVRGRTYRLKRRTKDYSDFGCGEGYYSTKVLPSTRMVDVQVLPDYPDDNGGTISGKRTFALPDFDKFPNMQRWDLGPVPRSRVTLTINPDTWKRGKYTWLLSNSARRPTNADNPRNFFEQIIPNSTMEQVLFNVQSRYVYVCTSNLVDDDDLADYGDNGLSECFSIFVQKPSLAGASVEETALNPILEDDFAEECTEGGNNGMVYRAYYDDWNAAEHWFDHSHYNLTKIETVTTDSLGNPLVVGKKYDISIFRIDQGDINDRPPPEYLFGGVRIWWGDSDNPKGNIRLAEDSNELFGDDAKYLGVINQGGYKGLVCGGKHMFMGMVDNFIGDQSIFKTPKEGIKICINITDDLTVVPPKNPALPAPDETGDGGNQGSGGGNTDGMIKSSVYPASITETIGGNAVPVPDLTEHTNPVVWDFGASFNVDDDISVELDDDNLTGKSLRILFSTDITDNKSYVFQKEVPNKAIGVFKKRSRYMIASSSNMVGPGYDPTSYDMRVVDQKTQTVITQTGDDGGSGGSGGTCKDGFVKAKVYGSNTSANINGSIVPVPFILDHDPFSVYDLGSDYNAMDSVKIEMDDSTDPGTLYRIVFKDDLEDGQFYSPKDLVNGTPLTTNKKGRYLIICGHTRVSTSSVTERCMKVTSLNDNKIITQTLISLDTDSVVEECPDGFTKASYYPATETSSINGSNTPVPEFSKYQTFNVWNLSASNNYNQNTGLAIQVDDDLVPNNSTIRVIFTDSINDQNSFKGEETLRAGTTLNTTMKGKYMLICTMTRQLSMNFIPEEICVKVINKSGGAVITQSEYNITGGGGPILIPEPENQATPPGGGQIPLGEQYEYEVIGAEDAQALKAGPGNSNRFTLYGELTKKSEYLDIKSIPFAEVVFSTINTPMSRTLQDWNPEGENVYIDTFDFGVEGEDYITGPGYYGRLNGAQFIKPDFCNEHYLSPLNAVEVNADTAYRIRRSQKDVNQFLGTARLFGATKADLTKQHNQNSRFKDYDVTLLPRNKEEYPAWEYFVTTEKNHLLFGVYNRHEKKSIEDWSIDGEKLDHQIEKVDVDSEQGPVYWANYDANDPLHEKVDWVSQHWLDPINPLKKVTIKKVGGEIVHNTQFEVGKTYKIKQKSVTDYDIIFYENYTGFPTMPNSNNDYKKVGVLKAGFGDNTYLRLAPTRPELFLGANNIKTTDFRHKDHRFWSRRGVPVDLIFEEIDYMEGPCYWADHTSSLANSSPGGPWFSKNNQEGNIPSSFTVQMPIVQDKYWHNPLNEIEGISPNQLYEVKPYGIATYPYTITLWETTNRTELDPKDSPQRKWTKISETRRKGTTQPFLVKPTSRYLIVGCQETGVARTEDDWSPKGMPIELQFTRIVEQEGASFYGNTNTALNRGSTAWTNPHWKGFTFLGTSTGAPLIASVNYKVSVSKNTRNAKYRHSIYSRATTNVSVPMTSSESGFTTYNGADIAKGSYGSKYNSAKITGTGGNWLILSTHKFNKETTPSKTQRTLTNWSPKGEFVQLNIIALDSNLVPDWGLIGKILSALSALASALLLLLLLFKYVPPTDWLLEFNIDGPFNEVFPTRIPCEDPNNPGKMPDNDKTWHGWRWTYYNEVRKQLPPHSFFWTAEPKFLNVYADEMSSLYARVLGLRHHGYFFDTTSYIAMKKKYKASGIGFCNLTQTFGFGILRCTNNKARRITLADNLGFRAEVSVWGPQGYSITSTKKFMDTTDGLNEAEIEERNEHIKLTNTGWHAGKHFPTTAPARERNSRRTFFETNVNPQFFADRQKWSNPNVTKATGYYAWPRVLNTYGDNLYKRANIDLNNRWFRPAMVRSVDCYYEATTALATTSGFRNWDRVEQGDTKTIKTMKMGENRDRSYSKKANDDYKSLVGSVKAYDKHQWYGADFPFTSPGEIGSGNSQFYDNIFSDDGFTCYIYDYWKTTSTSHNHAWIMAMEEINTWPTNSETVAEDYFYIGMTFDLDVLVTDTDNDCQQMTFMGLNFTTDNDEYNYHEMYPTKETDYMFRFNGEPSTNNQIRGQKPTKRTMEVWSTKKVKWNSIISKLYWGFYLMDESGGKPHYYGHNISNLRPLSSMSNPRNNVITDYHDWARWKQEQEQANQGQDG